MEQRYTRISGLDDKIKSVSMPYLEWKVLFVIGENTVLGDITELIDEGEDVIQSALDLLLEKGLIEITESAGEETEQVTEKEKKTDEEAVPEEEEIDLKEEEQDEINLTEMEEEEEQDEKTRIKVSAVEEEAAGETEEEIAEEEEQADDKTDLSGLFDESEAEEPPVETASAPPVEPEKKEPAKTAAVTPTGKKIMVIDDSIVIRKMIEIALEEENYHLINATSGKEGMDSFEKDKPDLIILDMMLPDMNGIDLLKKIKEKSDTPVIMLSGKDSPQLVENAKEVGVNDFLPKPFKDEELVEKVKNLIN